MAGSFMAASGRAAGSRFVADWHMDEASGTRANSASGGLYPLLQTGTVGSMAGDIFANAAAGFDASNYLGLPDPANLDSMLDGSASFWFATRIYPVTGEDFPMILAKRGRASFFAYQDISGIILEGAGSIVVPSCLTYNAWQTFLVAFSVLAGTAKVYKNGSLIDNEAWTPGSTSTNPLRAGVRSDGFPWMPGGGIGPIRMAPGDPTAGQIANPFANLP